MTMPRSITASISTQSLKIELMRELYHAKVHQDAIDRGRGAEIELLQGLR